MSLTLSRESLEVMPRRERANLINGLSGYKSANLLATVDASGQTNLALISSVFHVGANPPLVGFLMRPHTVPRHSLENLLESGSFTLNGVAASMVAQAHQSSARYSKSESEFDATGLTVEYSESIQAPYVAESPLQIGLKLVEHQTLELNGTVLIVGQILEVHLATDCRADDGHLDLATLELVAVGGLDEYFSTRSLGRQPYAKAPERS